MIKRIGIIDMFASIGGFTLAAQEIPNCDVLLAVEGNIVASCIYEFKYPSIPRLTHYATTAHVTKIHEALLKTLEAAKMTHKTFLHGKTNNTYYHTSIEHPETDAMFKQELIQLTWLILECEWLFNRRLLHDWAIETDPRLLQNVDDVTRAKVTVHSIPAILFGIPQEQPITIICAKHSKFQIHPDPSIKIPTWSKALKLDPLSVMFHSRYEYKDIADMVLRNQLKLMNVRLGHELPFEFRLNQTCMISMGIHEESVIVPLTPDQIGQLVGFPEKYCEIELFRVYEKEQRNLIILSKWPLVSKAILQQFLRI